jgi:hypothetical protein
MINSEKCLQVILCGTVTCLMVLVSLSGCTSTSYQNTNQTTPQLKGTWVGTAQMPMVGGRENTSISQIIFVGNTAEATLESSQGLFTMNYTYAINGNTLSLTPTFSGGGGFPGGTLQNGTHLWNNTTRPPMNETWPNGTRPGNWTRPSNWTAPGNQTWNPGGGQRSLSVSFTYSLNADRTILTLNGAEFRKVR